jgi:hypothetical protein
MSRDPYEPDDHDDFEPEDEYDAGEECGRWFDGKLGRHCSMAGTEFCDWDCPLRDRSFLKHGDAS